MTISVYGVFLVNDENAVAGRNAYTLTLIEMSNHIKKVNHCLVAQILLLIGWAREYGDANSPL